VSCRVWSIVSAYVIFFFSSRRRHTRFSRDWSSDVCSSDLDLGVQQEVRRIEAAFYQHSAALILLPEQVEMFVSVDGSDFELVGTATHALPIDQYGAIQRDFVAEVAPRPAPYLGLAAHPIGHPPDT